MAVIKVQAEIQMATAVPEDAVVNGWYFSRPGAAPFTPGEIDLVLDEVDGFYDGIGAFMSVLVALNNTDYTVYDMNDPPPRVPMLTEQRGMATRGATALPNEVALCLSFKGDPVVGVPPARLRGRLFIGPWAEAANEDTSGRPAGLTAVLGLALGGQAIINSAALAAAGINWVVYSPTRRGAGAAEDGTAVVTSGWVDDAWDTQRRRGLGATARQVFS